MPHGDFSDMSAFFCAGLGAVTLFAPNLLFTPVTVGGFTIAPFFDGEYDPASPLAGALQFCGALLFYFFFTLYMVRWNTVNGKGAGLGMLCASANAALVGRAMDGGFKPRMWHVVAGLFLCTALHLMFNANPMLTSKMLAEKEAKKKK
mmetsp:Transcript_14359/g.47166  ORF Transcript_14359/g.47166 Transcript_14359/m.47166 type:complete len:148 (+) Transcript_14359:830-1273(+)